MRDEEIVKVKCSNATALPWYMNDGSGEGYDIRDMNPELDVIAYEFYPLLGQGPTESDAWSDAASRIQRDPVEQEGK